MPRPRLGAIALRLRRASARRQPRTPASAAQRRPLAEAEADALGSLTAWPVGNVHFGGSLPAGTHVLSYKVIGVEGELDRGTITFNIEDNCLTPPPFQPETGRELPAAVPDKGVVPVGATEVPVPVLDNDALPNGVTELVVTRAPSYGTAIARTNRADWDILYVAQPGFVGQDTFSYQVTDTLGEVTQADVVIDVLGEPQPPVTVDPPVVEPPVVDPPVVKPPAPAPAPAPAPVPVEPFFPATGDDGPDYRAAAQEVARTLAVPFGAYLLVVVGGLVIANRRGHI